MDEGNHNKPNEYGKNENDKKVYKHKAWRWRYDINNVKVISPCSLILTCKDGLAWMNVETESRGFSPTFWCLACEVTKEANLRNVYGKKINSLLWKILASFASRVELATQV